MEVVFSNVNFSVNEAGNLCVVSAKARVGRNTYDCSAHFMEMPAFDKDGNPRWDGVFGLLLNDLREKMKPQIKEEPSEIKEKPSAKVELGEMLSFDKELQEEIPIPPETIVPVEIINKRNNYVSQLNQKKKSSYTTEIEDEERYL